MRERHERYNSQLDYLHQLKSLELSINQHNKEHSGRVKKNFLINTTKLTLCSMLINVLCKQSKVSCSNIDISNQKVLRLFKISHTKNSWFTYLGLSLCLKSLPFCMCTFGCI